MPIHKIVMNSDLHGSAGQCLIHQTIASFLKSKRTGMHLLKQMYALSNHDLWKVENQFQFHNPFKMLTPFFFENKRTLISHFSKYCETVSFSPNFLRLLESRTFI